MDGARKILIWPIISDNFHAQVARSSGIFKRDRGGLGRKGEQRLKHFCAVFSTYFAPLPPNFPGQQVPSGDPGLPDEQRQLLLEHDFRGAGLPGRAQRQPDLAHEEGDAQVLQHDPLVPLAREEGQLLAHIPGAR